MKPKHRRALALSMTILLAGVGITMTLRAFQNNLLYFYSPAALVGTSLGEELQRTTKQFRLGGLVEAGSWHVTGATHTFTVMDGTARLAVRYAGLMPSLFREGQGVVAEGHFTEDVFIAIRVLAKHDENYLPPEVAKALKDTGHWRSQ